MKKLILLFSILSLFSCIVRASVSIIPMPRTCVEKKGTFTINQETVIHLSIDNEEMRNALTVWNDLMATAAGFPLEVSSTPRSSNVIRCRINSSLPNEEAYKLTVSKSSIQIEAKTPTGIFYAFQTLRQLMPPAIESGSKAEGDIEWNVPCVSIEDEPSFGYRGLMLDVSRHFMPKEVVKRYIDLMSFHKLNTFHWHLTDDQGWRIEIKKYPKLTSIGGFRDKTIIGHARSTPYQWNTERYGGFYTQEDVKEVVAYAQKRFVEVIPEIEMPGHAVAALTAYPEYSCSGGPFEVEGRWGVFHDIFCTKEATFEFMQNVLDEVVALFPSSYIHIGGDEAPRTRWKNCVHCQKRMIQENLTKESELQTYFVNRIERYLNTKGKQIIGWDEIMEGGIPHRSTVMSWRGEKGGITAAKAGYDVIMTPNNYLYLNRYQFDPKTEPLAIGGFTPLEKVYNYHPVPSSLTPEEAIHIKGVQGNLWTEYITSGEQLEYMVYPRAAALSEIAWSKKENKDYEKFYLRLLNIEKHYDAMKLNYCKTIYGKSESKSEYTAGQVDLSPIVREGSTFASGPSCFSLENHFVWCGSAIQAKEDGKYYLFYSAMESGASHPKFGDAWLLGSKIGVATSDSPFGGYKNVGFVYNKDGYTPDKSSWDAQMAHNPHVKWFNGKYYLYYCGSVDPGEQANIKGKLDQRSRIQQNLKLGVLCFNSIKELLEGKFTCNEQPLLSPRTRVKSDNVLKPSPEGTIAGPDNIIMVNPSVVYRPSDQKYLLYFKGNIYDPTWRGIHGVAISNSPSGPFTAMDQPVFEFKTENNQKLSAEDPYVWYHRKDKCFYAVFKDFTGEFTKGEPWGLAIMYSKDGLHWELPEKSLFMKKEITLKNGTAMKVDRLERPQLLLDKNDNPMVLYAACSISPLDTKQDGSSFNIQIPITKSRK